MMLWPARARALSTLAGAMLVALIAIPGAVSGSAGPPPHRLIVSPDSVHANGQGLWHLTLRLENLGDSGLYPDSLTFEWSSDDSAAGVYDLSTLAHGMSPAGAHEQSEISLNMPSLMERGRVELRFTFLDSKKRAWVVRKPITVTGDSLADRYPVQPLVVDGQAAELLVLPEDPSAGPTSELLLLPASGVPAASIRRRALALHDRGHAVAVLCFPVPGGSEGRGVAAGPMRVRAAQAAIGRLAPSPTGDARRLLIWGEGQGGTTALGVAAGRDDVLGVVAVDPVWRASPSHQGVSAQAGAGAGASVGHDGAGADAPLLLADRITAPVLVLRTDEGGDSAPYKAFVESRTARGLPTEVRGLGGEDRPLRRGEVQRLALGFIARLVR